jgi:hypothetical protein
VRAAKERLEQLESRTSRQVEMDRVRTEETVGELRSQLAERDRQVR